MKFKPACEVSYFYKAGNMCIIFSDKTGVFFNPRQVRLIPDNAADSDLYQVELYDNNEMVRWPKLGVAISVNFLVAHAVSENAA